jgi:hypothetical protein
MSLHKFKELYRTFLPLPCAFSTIIGIDAGSVVNKITPEKESIGIYSNMIGCTSIGIITGITYPISFPLFGCYFLYKNRK